MPTLPGKNDKEYWALIEYWAKHYGSDGCTGVKDWYVQACWEHDYHHKYGVTLFREPITFDETNTRFRQVIQMFSKMKWFSPLSWERYLAVSSPIGRALLDKHRAENLQPPDLNSGDTAL